MSFTNKDCIFYKKGNCYLSELPGVNKVGNDYFDNIHPCDFMLVPCFSDVDGLKNASIGRELKNYKRNKGKSDYTTMHLVDDIIKVKQKGEGK